MKMPDLFPVMDIEVMLNRIPRPERSGCIAVAFMLVTMYHFLVPSYALEEWCQLFPWGCPAQLQTVTQEEKKRAVPLYFGNGLGGAKHVCHMDIIDDGNLAHTSVTIPKELIGSFMPEISESDWMAVQKFPGITILAIYGPYDREDYRLVVHGQDVKMRWHCPKESNGAFFPR